MSPNRFRAAVLCICFAAVVMLSATGCKKKESPADTATVKEATTPVAKANQLSGSWYREGEINSDQTVGLEFAPDGKKLTFVANDGGRLIEITVDYTLLENGRMRLTNPLAPMLTEVLILAIDGNRMTAKAEGVSEILGGDGTFTKLDGKSIATRHQERLKEIAAEREAKRQADLVAQQALQKKAVEFLSRPNLAIVPSDGGGVGSFRLAMDLKPDGENNWTGTGYHETANVMFARNITARTAPAADGKLSLVVQMGEVTGPPGAGQMRNEQFPFVIESVGGDLQIAGNGQSVRAEPEISKALTEKYTSELKKQQEIVENFCAKLGHFAILEGDLGVPNAPNAQLATYTLALLRVKDKDEYLFTNIRPNQVLRAEMFNQSLPLIVRDGKAYLVFSQSDVITLADGSEIEFDATLSGRSGKMKTTKSLSLDQLQAARNKIGELVKSMASKPLVVNGVFFESYTYENGKIRPVQFTLSSPDGKSITGNYLAETFGTELPVTGQFGESLLGLTLQMQTPSIKPMEGGLQYYVEQGAMTLALELVDGEPVITGRMDRGDGANRFELAVPSAERTKKLRALFDAHVSAGGKFQWARSGYNSNDDIVSLTLTADGDKLTGTAQMRKYSAPVSGEIKEVDGQLILKMNLALVEGQRNAHSGPFELWVLPFGETFHLSGKSAFNGAVVNLRFISLAPVK